jgi:hypothetical protein
MGWSGDSSEDGDKDQVIPGKFFAHLVLGSKGPKGATCTGAGSLVFTGCRYVTGTVSS